MLRESEKMNSEGGVWRFKPRKRDVLGRVALNFLFLTFMCPAFWIMLGIESGDLRAHMMNNLFWPGAALFLGGAGFGLALAEIFRTNWYRGEIIIDSAGMTMRFHDGSTQRGKWVSFKKWMVPAWVFSDCQIVTGSLPVNKRDVIAAAWKASGGHEGMDKLRRNYDIE